MVTLNIPSLAEFKSDVESNLGYPLTEEAIAAIEDFWKNWTLFNSLIEKGALSIKVNVESLGEKYPSFSRYLRWTGSGTAGVIAGIITIFFHWQGGLALIILGLALHFWGSRVKFRGARNFTEEIIKAIVQHPAEGGYAILCSHYISGILHLSASNGSASWPQHPSNVVSGEQSFIAV